MAAAMRAVASGPTLIGGRQDAGPPRHFLDIDQYETGELRNILDLGIAYKNGRHDRPLEGLPVEFVLEWTAIGKNAAEQHRLASRKLFLALAADAEEVEVVLRHDAKLAVVFADQLLELGIEREIEIIASLAG